MAVEASRLQHLRHQWTAQEQKGKRLAKELSTVQRALRRLRNETDRLVEILLEAEPDFLHDDLEVWDSVSESDEPEQASDADDPESNEGLEEEIDLAIEDPLSVLGLPLDRQTINALTQLYIPVKTPLAGEERPQEETAKRLSETMEEDKPRAKKRRLRELAKQVDSIPVDAEGNFMLPVTVLAGKSEVTLLHMGHVVSDREGYHTGRYIYPVGFKSQRLFTSFTHPDTKTIYTSEILEAGENPTFRVTAADCPDHPMIGTSPSGAWKAVLDAISSKNAGSANTHASGPDYFGLSNPAVMKCIQSLPHAEQCRKFKGRKGGDPVTNTTETTHVSETATPDLSEELHVPTP